ncbi:MAG TPA: hypothetical protein VFA21_15025 [Pyrinomonadaceae bacterium]|nr:hypothetical protein [Pyrinomonadaceae bacterium]
MKKLTLIALTVVALAFALTLSAFSKQGDKEAQRQEARNHTEWVARSLKEMQAVKVGMTRADLLKVFEEEGGISTRTQQTYVYRECPYFKVDVRFEPVGELHGKEFVSSGDKIVNISRPYLAWSVAD